ncbi:MAG: hypothetical protein RBR71_05335 [Gudongella sp.]|nr:hypothetical protein [Gudongella sp.]
MRHKNEPNCAVLETVAKGQISEERLLSYLKLKKEAKYEGLNSRKIEQKKTNEMFSEYGGLKKARDLIKSKNKKR